MSVQLKRDPLVIIPYTLFTLALLVLVGLAKITWVQFIAGLAALNVPALFGLTKSGEADTKSEPPKPPNAVLVLFVVVGLATATSACASSSAKRAAAETSYTGQLQQCAHDHDTVAEADACADAVRVRWAAKDAGAAQ